MDIRKADLAGLTGVDLARFWADRGVRVLPVAPAPAKRPLIGAWQDKATDDRQVIEAWWRQYPEARVGVATGDPGFDVLDFDVAGGKPGIAQLEKLLDLLVVAPGTFFMVVTPSGGRHLYFKGSGQRNKQNEKAIPGVDFRGAGGMVLAAGNPGYELKATPLDGLSGVEWDRVRDALAPATHPEAPPANQTARPGTSAPPPPPVVSVATRGGKLVAPVRPFEDPIGEESPLDWYTRNHDIDRLLADAGWTLVGEQAGRRHYRRPGKETDVSGNTATMADGRTVFYNFSSSVNLPTNTALSTAQLYAYFEHGGDMRAAASAIRRTLMPQRAPTTPPAGPPANWQATSGPTPGSAPQASGGAVVPMNSAATPDHIRDFWRQRPELWEIWFQATETGVSPWAILGYALAMVAVRIGPHVVLPPKTRRFGGVASLNLFVAIVGDTGDGKDEAASMAKPFIGAPAVAPQKPGTGQGIASLFTEQTKEGPVQINDTAYLHESEVSSLGAHADLQGSTLNSTLLSVYMAQQLGEAYANKEKRRPVPAGRYRLALTVGVQPSNSHILLNEENQASGLPQRFIWMPATWPDAIRDHTVSLPAPPELTPWRAEAWMLPGSLDDSLDATGWSPSDAGSGLVGPKKEKKGEEAVPLKEEIRIDYDDRLWRELSRMRFARDQARKKAKLAGERTAGAADSHLMLTRLKIAALLSIWLDRSIVVGWEAWELAGCVIWVSNNARVEATAELQRKAKDQVDKRVAARAQADAAVKATRDAGADALVIKITDRIVNVVKKAGDGWATRREVALGLASRDKKSLREAGIELDDVLSDMVTAGVLEHRDADGVRGEMYRSRR